MMCCSISTHVCNYIIIYELMRDHVIDNNLERQVFTKIL